MGVTSSMYAIGAPDVGGLYLGTLDIPKGKRLTGSESAAIYANGWLMFVRGSRLIAQKLNIEQGEVEGDPITVAETTSFEASSYGAAHFGLRHWPCGLPCRGSKSPSTDMV
jgi:hypothetical protein